MAIGSGTGHDRPMARMPRFFAPDLPLHVTQRGNNRQAIFHDDSERSFLLGLLGKNAVRHRVSIHAYVLMTNHVHLLATPHDAIGVPRLMQAVGHGYASWFNTRHARTGTLWEGRYRATAVEEEGYLLRCMRYIELNPVRAGLVERPGDYAWSSFRANAWGERDRLVTPHAIYRSLGRTPSDRAAAYVDICGEIVLADELARIRDASLHGWALGGATFHAAIDATGRRADRLPKGRTRARDV